MGRLRAKSDYEELRKARIFENQARLASIGITKTVSELRSLTSPPKTNKTCVRRYVKIDYSSTPLRRSARLSGKTPESSSKTPQPQGELRYMEGSDSDESDEEKGPAKSDYEELRKARIFENQARLASLGITKTASELRSLTSPPKTNKTCVRRNVKVDYSSMPLRRSARLSGKTPESSRKTPPPKGELRYMEGSDSDESDEEKGRGNRSLVRGKRRLNLKHQHISEEALARRCTSKGRGSVYHPCGICCHFCRQKKLCGEEDCKRCGDLDMSQPCIGKTDCSICHSTNGILCRACLKVRYGEEMEEVKANKEWICPHCTEEKGINPHWICNSSFCLKKRKMVPTGIAIFRAREMGYRSVAHLLMDELRRAGK